MKKAEAVMEKHSQVNSSIIREKVGDALQNSVEPPPEFTDVARAISWKF